MTKPLVFFAAASALFLQSTPLLANSGPALSATPLTEITVDGDLLDWPNDIARHELSNFDPEVSDKPAAADVSARFAVGYDADQKALYVALKVQDDASVTERMSKSLPNGLGTNQDGALLYLDLKHRASFAENIEFSFVSRPIAVADDALLPDGIVSQARRMDPEKGAVSYEWRIDLPALLKHQNIPADVLSQDWVIGFDVLYFDRDSDEDGSIIKWTPGPNDGQDNTRLGDLFFLKIDRDLTSVAGTTQWAGTEDRPPRYAHLVSMNNPGFVVRGKTESDGSFEIKAPVGEYSALASDSRSLLRDAIPVPVQVERSPVTISSPMYGRMPTPDLDTLVPALMAENGTRAVGIAWVREGKIVFNRTFGVKANGDPADENTRFRVASITKPITTMTVLSLVENGLWSLDTPLATHWVDPDLTDDARANALTSRLALRHLTGLPNWRGGEPLSFLHAPGTKQSYSGEGFEYMRRAIERATNEGLEAHAKREVLGPAGMEQSSYQWSDDLADDYAGEFFATGAQLEHYRGDRVNAAANLLSTPSDLARFAQWVLAKRKAQPALFDMMEETNSPEMIAPDKREIERFGLGWIVHDKGGVRTLEHSGGQVGIRTHLVILPDRDEALVVLTNSSAGWPIIRALFNATLNRDNSLENLESTLYGPINH